MSACVNFSTIFGYPCLGNSYTAGLEDDELAKGLQVTADAAVSQEDWKYSADSECNLSRCDVSRQLNVYMLQKILGMNE